MTLCDVQMGERLVIPLAMPHIEKKPLKCYNESDIRHKHPMKHVQHAVRSFARKHPHAVLVATAVLAVASLAAVETSGVLPLEGQATPMYGPLPVSKTRTKASSSRPAAKSKSSRVITRTASSLKGAAPSSAAAKKWTGTECADYASLECAAKLHAAVQGDMACFTDEKCYKETRYCRSLDNEECATLKIRRWAYDAFFPGCVTDECAADVTVIASPDAPKALKECVRSPLCRELLANFRRGDFACRRHEPCLDALAALTGDKACDALPWCKAMKAIDERYTKYAFKCTDGPTAACAKLIGVDVFAAKDVRRVECRYDSVCEDDAVRLAESLGENGYYPAPDAGCFLWEECKYQFKANMDWACRPAVNRQPMCSNYSAVWAFLTETNPQCVLSAESRACKNALKKMIAR